MPAIRIARSAQRFVVATSLAALAAGCVTAEAPTTQELSLIDEASSPLVPATSAERALIEQQDLLTQAKFWAGEYDKNPNEYEASLKYARVLRAIGSSPRSAEVSSQALSLKPGDLELSLINAQSMLDQGKPDEAAIALARAEVGGQGDWRMLSLIGVTMDSLDQHGPAQDYYRRALDLSPENPKILSNLGLSYALAGKPGLAEQTLRQASTLPGADNRITQNLVLVLGVQGKFDEVEAVAGDDMPKALIDSNRDYFRAMLNPSRSWDTLRGTPN